jgi:hypothetical protein
MFTFLLRVKAMHKLGLARPFKYILLVLFIGCVIAGFIYAAVVIHAVNERSQSPHVHAHSSP